MKILLLFILSTSVYSQSLEEMITRRHEFDYAKRAYEVVKKQCKQHFCESQFELASSLFWMSYSKSSDKALLKEYYQNFLSYYKDQKINPFDYTRFIDNPSKYFKQEKMPYDLRVYFEFIKTLNTLFKLEEIREINQVERYLYKVTHSVFMALGWQDYDSYYALRHTSIIPFIYPGSFYLYFMAIPASFLVGEMKQMSELDFKRVYLDLFKSLCAYDHREQRSVLYSKLSEFNAAAIDIKADKADPNYPEIFIQTQKIKHFLKLDYQICQTRRIP